jgi:NAD(P)-dependent dehydrogenase (short-subunit alcohol dehydrogenase family)
VEDWRLDGRVALVTGSARGIGSAYARGLASHGATVVVADVLEDRAKVVADTLRSESLSATSVRLDVSDEDSVQDAMASIDSEYGRLDILVNNAAIMLDLERPFKPFQETTWVEWCRVMEVNAGGPFLCCRAAYPLFARQGTGRVVNITSDGIFKGYDLQLAYFASKGALNVMTRCLARELGEIGVSVNAIAPGFTMSEAVRENSFMQSVARPSVAASCALKHEQVPEDLVGTLLFLCGPASACITGQTLVVNCGAVML